MDVPILIFYKCTHTHIYKVYMSLVKYLSERRNNYYIVNEDVYTSSDN